MLWLTDIHGLPSWEEKAGVDGGVDSGFSGRDWEDMRKEDEL